MSFLTLLLDILATLHLENLQEIGLTRSHRRAAHSKWIQLDIDHLLKSEAVKENMNQGVTNNWKALQPGRETLTLQDEFNIARTLNDLNLSCIILSYVVEVAT
jgi:hypothetical protein